MKTSYTVLMIEYIIGYQLVIIKDPRCMELKGVAMQLRLCCNLRFSAYS